MSAEESTPAPAAERMSWTSYTTKSGGEPFLSSIALF